MFSLFGLCPLLVFLLLHPQEIFPALRAVPFLNLFAALSILGLLVDLRLNVAKVAAVPILFWLALFGLWCALTTWVRAGAAMTADVLSSQVIPWVVMLLLAHAVTSFRALHGVLLTLFGIALCVAFIAVHQAQQPFECLEAQEAELLHDLGGGRFDGRPCQLASDCRHGDVEPGAEYTCERPGLWGTSTIGHGRARYRGVLQDPNETALLVGIAMPIGFGLWQWRRRARWALLALGGAGLCGLCTVYTQSRGGQLVFLTVLGVYFVRRYGLARGLVLGLVGALPMLLLGGREGEEAESSALERTEALYAGLEMIRQYPLLGVGMKQFGDHHFIAAHNSYVLAAAELGFPGLFLWSTLLYLSVKTMVLALGRYGDRPEARVGAVWAVSLLSSFCGMMVGIFFLSFAYHVVLFIYLGLAGAFYCACRRHDPAFEVRYGLPEAAAVAALDFALIAAIFVYTRVKGV